MNKLILIFLFLTLSLPALAQRGSRGGGFSLGVIGGFTNAEQTHINTLRERANLRAGGISAGDLDRAMEFGAFLQWRYNFMGFQLRPTWFTQSEGSGTHEYSTNGQVIAGIFKLYPLESPELKLYFQAGVAWGRQTTEIKEDTFTVEAEGSNLGYLLGVGVELNFGPHGVFFEGGWRWLPIERNMVTSSSGTAASDSVSQSTANGELEYDNRDLSTNMSGTMMMLGYSYGF
jgi:hypothetical protein